MSKATSGSSIDTGDGDVPPSGIPYFAEYLGYQNVFVNGEPWSFSQQGDFTACQWDELGVSISVLGPNADFPIGKIVKRFWNIHNTLIIFGYNGQSNDVGATNNFADSLGPIAPFMQLAPIPNVLKAYTGGFTPTQSGVNAPSVGEIIDPAQFATLVPGHENINTGRVGAAVNRQMWSSAFGQAIAAAVPSDNIVLVINVGHGATSYNEDVRGANVIVMASWLAGVVTFLFTSPTLMGPGDGFRIATASPVGYIADYTALTVSPNGLTVTAALVSNPGAFVSGFALMATAPMVNLRTMVRYAVNTIAPALGMTTLFPAFCYNGNEANDDAQVIGNYGNQLADLRPLVNELGDIAGNVDDPYIVWPQVGWPVSAWEQQNPTLPGGASMIALGALAYSRDPANKLITFAQYATVAGGDGDSNAVGCIHYGVQGHFDNGERGAGHLLDKIIDGANVEPLQLLFGENILYRVANSTTVTGAFNKSAVIDTNMFVTDPGNHGVQYFSAVPGSGDLFGGGRNREDDVTSISVSTTTFGMVLDGQPAAQWGNYVGVGYQTATVYQEQNNTPIASATWASTGGGQVTYGTTVPHGLNPGDSTGVFLTNPTVWNTFPAQNALAGTTGSTLILPMTVNPGTPYIDSGNIVNNGIYGIARTQGLRSQIRETDITNYSTSTGAPLAKMHAIQFAPVDVYPSSKSIVTMLTELGMTSTFELVLDFANASCYSGSTNQVTNLGTSGATDDYWRGLSNVDITQTPTFNGSAGALDRTAFFSAAADGKRFTPQTTTDIFANIHKAGGQGTLIVGVKIPAVLTGNEYPIATCQGQGGGTQGPGWAPRIASNGQLVNLVKGAGTATAYSRNSTGILVPNAFALIGIGMQDGNPLSWMFTYDGTATTTAAGFETATPVFSSPSSGAAQSNAYIWINGSTGTQGAQSTSAIYFVLGSNTFLSQAQVLPLMRGLWRRQIANLP